MVFHPRQQRTPGVYKIGDFGLVRCTGDAVDCWVGFNDDEGDRRYLCGTYLSQNTHWKEADIFALALPYRV